MKVLNGKKSTLVYQLDNGQTLRVQPGQVSDPFIGTVALVRAIISSGTPKQVGFVVSNSYELNIIKDLPVAQSYYHATEEEAKAAIFEGKDFSKVDNANPLEVRINELQGLLAQKTKEYEELKLEVSKMSSISEEDYNYLKKQLADKDSELNAIKSRNDQLSEQLEKEVEDKKAVMIQRDDYKARYEKSSSELLEANNKLKAAVEATPVEKRNADGQTLEEVTDLFKRLQEQVPIEIKRYTDQINDLTSKLELSQSNSITAEEVEQLKDKVSELEERLSGTVSKSDYDDLKSHAEEIINSKDKEIAQLKDDGAKVYEGYTKAKAAVQDIMQKFGITYIDGQYVKQAN